MAYYSFEVDFQNCLVSNDVWTVSVLLSWIPSMFWTYLVGSRTPSSQCRLKLRKKQRLVKIVVPQYNNASLEYRWLTIHLKKKESTIHGDISDFILTNFCGQYLQKVYLNKYYIGDHTHMRFMKFVQFSIFILPFSNDIPPPAFPPLKMIVNQLRGYIILGWLLLSFWSAFVFSVNSWILSGFPLTSFHLVEADLVPRAIFKNQKAFSPSSRSEKARRV